MSILARWARTFGLTRALCVLLLLALVPLRVIDPLPLEEVRLRTFDFYQRLRPRQPVARPVTIVDIDEASLKEIGQWPWPRTIVADLVTQLTQLGAVAIGFDVIFAEPDRMSPSIAATSFRNLDDETHDKLRNLPSNDEVLAQAIRRSRVVVGQVGSATPAPRSQTEAALQTGFAVRGPDPSRFLVTFAGLLRNVAPIEQAAAGRGLLSIQPACRASPFLACNCRPTRTASSGFISIATIPPATFPPRTCCKGACPATVLRASSCSSAAPPSACSTSKRRRWQPPCPASRSMLRSSKAR